MTHKRVLREMRNAQDAFRSMNVGYVITQVDETTVTGAHVAEHEFVRALIRHGRCDTITIFAPADPSQRDLLAARFGGSRDIRVVPTSDLTQHFARTPPDIVQIPYLFASQIAYLRERFSTRVFPMTGLVHAIAHGDAKVLIARNLLFDSHALDVAVCPSRHVEQALLSICDEISSERGSAGRMARPRTTIIPLGVDLERFTPCDKQALRKANGIPADSIVAIYVGRLSPWTKADLLPLITAFSRAASTARAERLKLIIVGQEQAANYATALVAAAAELGVADQVDVWTNVPNEEIHQVYQLADIFVSPSDNVQETFGMTLVEAMACGLPVIAAAWSGYKEIVEHGVSGFLIPTYAAAPDTDVVDAAIFRGYRRTMAHHSQCVAIDVPLLAQHLALLATDSELRHRMGDGARRRAAAVYSWKSVIFAHEALWSEQRSRVSSSTRQGWRTSGIRPFTTDSIRHFRYYPSEEIKLTAALRIATSCETRLSTKTLEHLARFADIEPRCIGQLLDRLTTAGQETFECLRNADSKAERAIVFLLKHGVIELVR